MLDRIDAAYVFILALVLIGAAGSLWWRKFDRAKQLRRRHGETIQVDTPDDELG
jgi:hypothetical protein